MNRVEDQIDAAAKHLRETMQAGKKLTPWESTPKATKKKWLSLAEGTLRAADALRSSLKPSQEADVVDAFEICAKVAEGHANLVEEMRGIYPGDLQGALGRDANKMRKLAKAIRALRPQPSPDADGDAA